MRKIVVNGKACTLTPLQGRAVSPGEFIGQMDGRRVYRVLCFDGDDVIARNARHDGIIEAIGRQEVLDGYGLVEAV